MAPQHDPKPSINSWLEEELFQQYQHDQRTVDPSWRHEFEDAGATAVQPAGTRTPAAAETTAVRRQLPPIDVGPTEQLVPLRGIAAKIAENMEYSLSMPLQPAHHPVKVIDENRRIINQHRTLAGKSKVSYTHLIGWAIVQALESFPGLNHAFLEKDGEAFRLVRQQVNLGIAVDVEGRDGNRNLVVPNLKGAAAVRRASDLLSAYDAVSSI